MLDEQGLRREDFADGVPIILADGREWTLPKPVVFPKPKRYRRAIVRQDGEARWGKPIALDGDPYWGKLERIFLTDGVEHMEALREVGADLLRHNYPGLTDDDIADELLALVHDDEMNQTPENKEMWEELAAVAIGRGNFPMPDGSSSAG